MATKHTATYQGNAFKRTSLNKVYSHMVVGIQSIASRRAEVEKFARAEWKMNHKFHEQRALGGVYVGTFNDGSTYKHDISPEEQSQAQAYVALGVEGLVSKQLRSFEERMQGAWKTEDGLSTVYSAGWTSRLDLAVKLAARTPGGVIVEAVRS